MNILIYSPSSQRAADQQTQAEVLISLGHKVMLLTWQPPGELHNNFNQLGAASFSSSHIKGRSIFFFIKQAIYLARFCKRNKISVVFSNLQSNAVAAGLASVFVRAKFYYIRHNAEYVELKNSYKDKFINRLANWFSPKIIAISNNVKTQLIKEGVPARKILQLNLCYNIAAYTAERKFCGSEIRSDLNSEFIIIYIARLDALKRHFEAFETINILKKQNIFCKLVCIGEGPFRAALEKRIASLGLENEIILKGHVSNVFDYIEASDILLLLSQSEASNNAVKEAGMCKRTVVVCRGVGDFDEYIITSVNGFLIDRDSPAAPAAEVIRELYYNRALLRQMGDRLYDAVLQNFGMEKANAAYKDFFSKEFGEVKEL